MRISLTLANRLRAVPMGSLGNTTTELAIHPFGTTLDGCDYIFRVSTAGLVAEQPFSDRFRDYERILMLLVGRGMQLNIFDQANGDPRAVYLAGPGQGCAFSGNSRVDPYLKNGPVRDINVIYRKEKVLQASASLLCCAERMEKIHPLPDLARAHQFDILYSLGRYRMSYDMRQVEADPGAVIVIERSAGDSTVPITAVRTDGTPIVHAQVVLPA